MVQLVSFETFFPICLIQTALIMMDLLINLLTHFFKYENYVSGISDII